MTLRRTQRQQLESSTRPNREPSRVRATALRRAGARCLLDQQRAGGSSLRSARVGRRPDLQGRQLPLPGRERPALHERAVPPGHPPTARGLHRKRREALQALHRGRRRGRLLRAVARKRPVGRPPGALRGGQALQHPHRRSHGPVRRLRVTNEDDGDAEKQQPPYRTLHLLFKDDHYSSLHSNEEVTTVTPEEDAVVSSDKRPRSPTKVYDSPDKKSGKYQVALTKAVKFQEVVEAKSPQREGHTCIYAEENVPECGVFLPKQVLFRRGKRRVSGATLFSLVHVPSTSNLLPVMESPSTSESSSSSTASTTSETSSSSEEQEERSDTKPPVPPRPKATASTLRAVPVEYPSKAVFRKGRATAAAC